MSNDSSRCMIDGISVNEYMVLIDIGDMIIEQSSGGNSADIMLDPRKECRKIFQSGCIILIMNSVKWR